MDRKALIDSLREQFKTGKMSIQDVLAMRVAGEITTSELATIERVRPSLRMKVTDRGCVNVTGCGSRWGTTLYPDAWLRILDEADAIRSFIENNRKVLESKGVRHF